MRLYYLLLVALIINAFSGRAQENDNEIAVTESQEFFNSTNKIRRLIVGESMPDIRIRNVLNYKSDVIQFSEFLGKAVILDFWATWCTPCISALPKLDSFQKKFDNDLIILGVSQENMMTVSQLFKNLKQFKGLSAFTTVINDTLLSKFFYHNLLPHYVWIGQDGIVKAITGSAEVTDENIRKLVKNEKLNLPIKKDDLVHDRGKPIYGAKQRELGNELIYQSTIAGFRKDMPNGSFARKNFISLPNHTITRLYQLVFGKFVIEYLDYGRVVLEGMETLDDSLSVGIFNSKTNALWKSIREKNVYTYELFIPDSLFGRDKMFEFAQQDLNRFFNLKGINGGIEKRRMNVISLVRTSDSDKIATKGGNKQDKYTAYSIQMKNMPLSVFLSKFQGYFVKEGRLPIKNKTKFRSNADIEINCDLKDIDAVNKELEKYDLKFVEGVEEMEMIVIKKLPLVKN